MGRGSKVRNACIVGFLVLAGTDARAQTETFTAPTIRDMRLDWCRNWGANCGQPAADLFCREKRFDRAARFAPAPGVGRTLVFGDGRVCEGPQCDGFAAITCMATPPTSPPGDMRIMVPDRDRQQDVAPPVQAVPQPPPPVLLPLPQTPLQPPATPPPAAVVTEPPPAASPPPAAAPSPSVVTTPEPPPAAAPPPASLAVPLPRPRPPSLRPQESVGMVVAPNLQDLLVAVGPPIRYDLFTPLEPQVVAANWTAVLGVIDSYPAGASLYKCASGDCSLAIAADFEVGPDAPNQSVQLNFNVGKVPHAVGARWQVGYLPFPAFANGADIDTDPPGLVATGLVEVVQGWFEFDLKELATDLPPGSGEAVFYVRVLPVATSGAERIVGQPSNVMKVYYGAKLPPPEPFTFYSKEDVPGSRPDVTLVGLKFEPLRTVARWPPGCKTWEEKYGKEKNILEKVGDFVSGAWNWASKAYQWAKDRVIDIARALTLNVIPDSVLAFALDSALVSVGIPPDIPNLEQMMKEGVDGLASEMAKTAVQQIPTADLAANAGNLVADIAIEAAAEMAEDELRDRMEQELERRSRQAILTAAAEMENQLREDGKKALCKTTTFHGAFHVTVRNDGTVPATDVAISADAPPVYRGGDWKIDLDPGETMTLVAVGTPMLPHGPYSRPLLYPKEREDEDTSRWWNDIVYDRTARIEVTLPGALKCLGGDPRSQFCDREMIVAHTSPPQLVTDAYRFAP